VWLCIMTLVVQMKCYLVARNPDVHFWCTDVLVAAQRWMLDGDRYAQMTMKYTPLSVVNAQGKVLTTNTSCCK
jgi:hypothetical protein